MSESEAWIRDYADSLGSSYEELLERATGFLDTGDYWREGGRFEGKRLPMEFWGHFRNVTGKMFTDEQIGYGGFFSCSC